MRSTTSPGSTHRMRRAGVLIASAVLGIGLAAAPAAATKPGPWQDFHASDFTVPAGARCPFTLSSTVIDDHERLRTLATYSDGTPRTQQIVGRLAVRFENEDTGQSVKRNLTGNAIVDLRHDGSMSRMTLQGGHFAVGLRPGDPQGPAFLVFTGSGHAVSFDADGTRTITYGSGNVENICETLAAD